MKYPQYESAIKKIRDAGVDIDPDWEMMSGGKGGHIHLRIWGCTYNFFHSPWNDFGLSFIYTPRKGAKPKSKNVCDFHRSPDKIVELILMIQKIQDGRNEES